jgi:hypothetical protein
VGPTEEKQGPHVSIEVLKLKPLSTGMNPSLLHQPFTASSLAGGNDPIRKAGEGWLWQRQGGDQRLLGQERQFLMIGFGSPWNCSRG